MAQEAFNGFAAVGEVQNDFGSARPFLETCDCARVDLHLRVGAEGGGKGIAEGFGAVGVDGDAVGGKLEGIAREVQGWRRDG